MARVTRKGVRKKLPTGISPDKLQVSISINETELVGRNSPTSKRKDCKFVIFCEGETEENYFRGIGESAKLGAFCEPAIIIECLKPENDNSALGLLKAVLEAIDKRTTTNKISQKLEIGYDHFWVVFDGDEREEELEALFGNSPASFFDKCDEKNQQLFKRYFKHVKIAFSNRAFEHWILLHFERNITTFTKTECKTNKEKHNCGLDEAKEASEQSTFIDCLGEVCVVGYLRQKKYHPTYQKGDWRREKDNEENDNKKNVKSKQPTSSYCYEGLKDYQINGDLAQEKLVFHKIQNAIENAQYIRHFIGGTRPTANPYTDLDKLLSAIIHYEPVIQWGKFGEVIQSNNLEILVTINTQKAKISIKNKSNNSILINKNSINIEYLYNDECFYRHCQLLRVTIATPCSLVCGESTTVYFPLRLPIPEKLHLNPTYCLEIANQKFWLPLQENN